MVEQYLHFVTANWFTVILSLLVVMFVLNFATGLLEEQLSVIGKKVRIPASVRGATFDAVSSSLPEFLTSLVGLIILKEKGLEVGIGTIGGSAIFNILIIPALVLLFYKGKEIVLDNKGIKRDSIFYIGSILILLAGLYFNQLGLMSVLLILWYVAYVVYLYFQSKEHRKNNHQAIEDAYNSVKDIKVSYFKILISLILIYLGVEVAVVDASWIGEQLKVSVLIVSLILLAAITSIPDTMLSVKASRKGDIDAGLSNAVGSNIFDICIGLGLPIFIGVYFMKLHPQVDFSSQLGVFGFIIISTIAYFVIMSKKKIIKWDGLVLLLLYLAFVGYLLWIS